MVLDDFCLNGKIAIVTGGSNGIGRGIATGLAEAGADIACVYNRNAPSELAQVVKELGREFLAIHADLGDMGVLSAVVSQALEKFGHIDILVNNSGVCPRGPALEFTEAMWDETIQVNQKALYFLSQAVARQFVKQGTRGKIINLASMLSFLGGGNSSAYTASKHAVLGITKVLASEWGAKGINVNALAPGWIKTNLSEPIRNDPVRDQAIRARIPIGEWGDPSDFKGVAVLLASEASNYINGVTIPVDGGYLTK